jgi:hypothetical protein
MATNRLHEQLKHVIALEDCVGRFLTQQLPNLVKSQTVAELLENVRDTASKQKHALINRLEAISDGVTNSDVLPREICWTCRSNPSSILEATYTALNEAIIGYTTLSIIAKRFRDSAIIGEGNTTDIADQNTKNYVKAVRSISYLLHDVVIGELDHDGLSCECTCACCGIGLCICATYNRETLSNAWADAGPFADEGELLVLQPRSGSPAAVADLQQGDYIVAADGTKLASYATLYGVADGHQPGETIELKVRHASGELVDKLVTIP